MCGYLLRPRATALVGACLFLLAIPAFAQTPPVDPNITGQPGATPMPMVDDDLEARILAAEERIKALEKEEPSGDKKGDDGKTTTALEKRLADLEAAAKKTTYPTVKVGGFMQADSGFFQQDAANRAALGDIQDGVGFRRARLQASGNVTDFTAYFFQMDFGIAGRPSFTDVWGEQQQLPFFGNVRIGQFKQPSSMESYTSVRNIWFMERSLQFQAFDPFRRVGIMSYDKSESEMTTWAYGVYRTGGFANSPISDSRFATDIGDQGGFSFAGRMTHLLYYDEAANGRYLLHVGGSYNYSQITGGPGNPVPFYEARAIPEFFVGDPAGGFVTSAGTPVFVDSGKLAADSFNLYGLQLAGQYGAFHFQTEYMATGVNQTLNPNVFYDGAYAQAGYFLTGENRTYNRTFGVFDKLIPYTDFFGTGREDSVCGWGAWEVLGRWSYLNLSDPNAVPIATSAGPPPVPNAGIMNDSTVGLNWYWNPYTKLEFNWIHVFLNSDVAPNSDCNIYATRFQIEF